jgi:hypothetical protein
MELHDKFDALTFRRIHVGEDQGRGILFRRIGWKQAVVDDRER